MASIIVILNDAYIGFKVQQQVRQAKKSVISDLSSSCLSFGDYGRLFFFLTSNKYCNTYYAYVDTESWDSEEDIYTLPCGKACATVLATKQRGRDQRTAPGKESNGIFILSETYMSVVLLFNVTPWCARSQVEQEMSEGSICRYRSLSTRSWRAWKRKKW